MKEITEIIVIFLLIGSANSCSSTSSQFERKVTERDEELPADQEALYLKARNDPRSLTDAEWQLILDQATFYVTRQKGTERRWSSSHNKEKRSGTFKCTLCHQPLFSSNTVSYFSLEYFGIKQHKYDHFTKISQQFRNTILVPDGQAFGVT